MTTWRGDDPAPEGREPRLDDRVRGLLESHGGRVAFNGLRRALGVHPESLSRALRRLEREGVVLRREDGYVLAQSTSRRAAPRITPLVHPVASVQLPSGIPHDAVLGALAGRWFGSLRWVGVYDRPGDPWLVWSVGESGAHVMLSARRGTLRVLVEGEARVSTPPAVETAAWDLLRHALERLRPEAGASLPALTTFRRESGGSASIAGLAG